jgi:hypothetical protein
MSAYPPPVRGVIRRRLLVNAVVDPDEAATRLPAGLRPHVTDAGTVVGCCLLELEQVRPAWLPAGVGTAMRAAAHRLSVEWDDADGHTIVGVFVPLRHSDSRLAVALGGRHVPGLHRRADSTILTGDGALRWRVAPHDGSDLAIRVTATTAGDDVPVDPDEVVGRTCLTTDVGLSVDRRGRIEGARMTPDHRRATPVTIEALDSAFLRGFATARPAPSYLMRDVGVTWTASPAPAAKGTGRGRGTGTVAA